VADFSAVDFSAVVEVATAAMEGAAPLALGGVVMTVGDDDGDLSA